MDTKVEHEQLVIQGILDGKHSFTGPEHVVIDLTNRCDNNCIGCWTKSPLLGTNTPDKAWHRQQLNTELVLRLIDDLAAMGTSIIRFTGGGEPFLHKDIFECIKAVKKHNIFCAVTTSLNMIDHDEADQIIASGLDELSVSLWAASPAEYRATHPNKTEKTFTRITSTLLHIADKRKKGCWNFFSGSNEQGPQINLLNVISKMNFTGVEAMYDYGLRVKADSIYFTVVDIIEGCTDCLLLSDVDRRFVSEVCRRIRKKNRTLLGNSRIFLDNFEGFQDRISDHEARDGKYDKKRVETIPCTIGWLFCRVMADGQVAPCCRGVNIPMGNLHNRSFKEIWFSEKYNNFRKMAKNIDQHRSFFEKVGCEKMCDNHMHNLNMHRKLQNSVEWNRQT